MYIACISTNLQNELLRAYGRIKNIFFFIFEYFFVRAALSQCRKPAGLPVGRSVCEDDGGEMEDEG
jgi:hypothetical protein